MTSVFLIAALAALIIWAVLHAVRKAKKGGGCCGDREETVAKSAVRDRNKAHYPHTLTLRIGGMTCDNCARRVENALNSLDGVWATVRISDHRALVRMKDTPNEQTLRKAVQDAGYVVLGVESEANS